MNKILPWFALRSVPGIGNHLFKRLIDRFKSPELVFEASHDELVQIEGISPRIISTLKKHNVPEQAKREIDLVAEKGYRIVTMSDTDYPSLLLQTADPPPFLYVYGDLGVSIKNIAVVGCRNPTRYGISTTTRLSSELARLRITVVSGMARGIDTAAHDGAIMSKGKTIAVLGSGLENVYPRENQRLFHRIAENGAVVSEFHLKAGPEPHHFPIRNRIISGISLGTVVVEAARKSGALITARFAAEQNREVFAVPGYIHSYKSAGPHKLIKEGAKLVENAQDITDELSHVIKVHITNENINRDTLDIPPLTDEESLVFKALGPYPVHIDDLVRKVSVDPGKLSSILLQLELKGIVQQSPGKLFSIEIKNVI
ncbi:MAG: DNA-protecting protein DprA [Desulfobacteraceae bacterium]|nr:DNA-protecting protein DprA [Desulfobacteraceae bacterium]